MGLTGLGRLRLRVCSLMHSVIYSLFECHFRQCFSSCASACRNKNHRFRKSFLLFLLFTKQNYIKVSPFSIVNCEWFTRKWRLKSKTSRREVNNTHTKIKKKPKTKTKHTNDYTHTKKISLFVLMLDFRIFM